MFLRLRGVTKGYSTGQEVVEVLGGIDLEVNKGETLAILGPSGSGKTTLLNLISSLDKPDSGEILYGGKDLGKLTEYELSEYRLREVGFIFQFYHLIPEISVLENVMLPGLMANLKLEEAKERARELLSLLGMEKKAHLKPTILSGGERQRVAIARALFLKPSLILADEPTGNLDHVNAQIVIELLFSLVLREGSTLILVTHNPEVAKKAKKVYLLEKGHLVECSIKDEVSHF